MTKKSEEKIIKETKYCKIKSQGKVGEGEYTYSIEKIYIKELKRDEFVQEVLGTHITEKYIEAKEDEWNRYREQISVWEIEEYLYKI